MKLLADENISRKLICLLKEEGHDILDVYELGLKGALDKELLLKARLENRIVLTQDKDFAELFYTEKDCLGVILLSFTQKQGKSMHQKLLSFMNSTLAGKSSGSLIIISENYIHIRVRTT
ncbi:MAG: DUF5615 family PIN-like protein [Candidatus Woesearchaeota archaeon]|nr:DUF5615 family PIN-like protein [Candidatus Woesearchaeota archaeon]